MCFNRAFSFKSCFVLCMDQIRVNHVLCRFFSFHVCLLLLPVYLPVRVSLHVLKANYRVSFFAMNISKTKQTAKYAYYRLFGTSHFIHEHGGGRVASR